MKEKAKSSQQKEMLQLVESIARRYTGKGLELNDLIGEGCVGLAESNPDATEEEIKRNIHNAIRRALNAHGYTLKLSEKQSKTAGKINRARIILEQNLGRKPSTEEIADATNIPQRTVSESIRMRTKTLSADAPLNHRQSTSLIDVIEDKNATSTEDIMTRQALRQQLQESIGTLDEREQKVITAYYGIGQEALTLAQIADRLGIKRERARQIRDRALRRMRNNRRLKDEK